MLHKYHAAMLQDTLGRIFSRTALVELIAANVGQDSLGNLIGHDAYHFDFSKFKEGLAYIENQHAIIQDDADPHMMRAAFGHRKMCLLWRLRAKRGARAGPTP